MYFIDMSAEHLSYAMSCWVPVILCLVMWQELKDVIELPMEQVTMRTFKGLTVRIVSSL